MKRARLWGATLAAVVALGVSAGVGAQGPVEPVETEELETANVEVTVWRGVSTGALYLSTRPEGGRWRTENMALDMSARSRSGRFHQSNAITVTVPLVGGVTANVEVTAGRTCRTRRGSTSAHAAGEHGTRRTRRWICRQSGSGRLLQSTPHVAVPLCRSQVARRAKRRRLSDTGRICRGRIPAGASRSPSPHSHDAHRPHPGEAGLYTRPSGAVHRHAGHVDGDPSAAGSSPDQHHNREYPVLIQRILSREYAPLCVSSPEIHHGGKMPDSWKIRPSRKPSSVYFLPYCIDSEPSLECSRAASSEGRLPASPEPLFHSPYGPCTVRNS